MCFTSDIFTFCRLPYGCDVECNCFYRSSPYLLCLWLFDLIGMPRPHINISHKKSIHSDSNRCTTGCNGSPIANLLQLSKFGLKLRELMKPVVATTTATGEQRQRTLSNGWKNELEMGVTLDFHGYPLKTDSVAVPLLLGIWEGWNILALYIPNSVSMNSY